MSAWKVVGAALALAAAAGPAPASPRSAPARAAPPAGAEAPAGPARERPAVRMPNIAYLTSIDGALPADSTDQRAFVAGLRAAFDPDFYLTEGAKGGPLRVSTALASRFRLVRGDAFGDEWQVAVTIMSWRERIPEGPAQGRSVPPRAGGGDAPAARGGARGGSADSLGGLRVSVAVLSPEAAATGARPLPVREDLVLDVPLEPRSEWYRHAGRMVGLLVVEELHHQSGDLAADTRVRLDRTVRKPVVVRDPPTPRR